MATGNFELLQSTYGTSKEQIRRAQISFASNLTGRYASKGELNGQPVTMYFMKDDKNRFSVVHVYEDNQEYTNIEWVCMAQNLGFDNNELTDEYIQDVVLYHDEEIMKDVLAKMHANQGKVAGLDDNARAYYSDLIKRAAEINKQRESAEESGR